MWIMSTEYSSKKHDSSPDYRPKGDIAPKEIGILEHSSRLQKALMPRLRFDEPHYHLPVQDMYNPAEQGIAARISLRYGKERAQK
jgi:hypothetical protein